MATKAEVISFLGAFKDKMKIWDVIFRDDRGKNFQTLIDLELTSNYRKNILTELKPNDYCEGPLPDKLLMGADMWVFGKTINGKEVYIKITMGALNSSVICISFHIAEHKLNYPLK